MTRVRKATADATKKGTKKLTKKAAGKLAKKARKLGKTQASTGVSTSAPIPGTVTARSALYGKLSVAMRTEYVQFEQSVIKDHLKQRKDRGAFEIDRRNRFLGHAGRITLRDPNAEGGPEYGSTTSDRATATTWAKEHYIPGLWREHIANHVQLGAGGMTVWRACERYLVEHCGTTLVVPDDAPRVRQGPDKLQSRISMIRRHVAPMLGPVNFHALTFSRVQDAANALTLVKAAEDGSAVTAASGTQHNFISAIMAVWRHCFPGQVAPFEGVKVPDPGETEDDDNVPTRIYNFANIQAELREEGDKSALKLTEFETALVGAMHYDAAQMARPCIRSGPMIANTVHVFVALVALGVRISELRRLRWCDINFDDGYVLIHVSKRRTRRGRKKPPIRIVPLQKGHVPWLRLLQKEQGVVDTTTCPAYVFRTSRFEADTKMGAQTTLVCRAGRALAHAGVKPPGKATHWGRSTYATWGKGAPGVKGEELQHFLGHAAFSGSTDEYIAMLTDMLRHEHRTFITIPSPARVRQLLNTFTPAETKPWRKRRKVQSRSRVAREARARDARGR